MLKKLYFFGFLIFVSCSGSGSDVLKATGDDGTIQTTGTIAGNPSLRAVSGTLSWTDSTNCDATVASEIVMTDSAGNTKSAPVSIDGSFSVEVDQDQTYYSLDLTQNETTCATMRYAPEQSGDNLKMIFGKGIDAIDLGSVEVSGKTGVMLAANEPTNTDTDADGIVDYLDTDIDGNLLMDVDLNNDGDFDFDEKTSVLNACAVVFTRPYNNAAFMIHPTKNTGTIAIYLNEFASIVDFTKMALMDADGVAVEHAFDSYATIAQNKYPSVQITTVALNPDSTYTLLFGEGAITCESGATNYARFTINFTTYLMPE